LRTYPLVHCQRPYPGTPGASPALLIRKSKQVARTTAFVVRVFSLTIILAVSYSRVVLKLRRPFLSKLTETDLSLLERAFNRARALHDFYLTAWVFLPDHWHAICAPLYPASISLAIKSVKQSSMSAINRGREADGELWQPRFFDRALRTVQEYSEEVEYPPEPRQGRLGAAAAGLAMVELQRVFGHERG
jgi:REP element-mobilizing transposase RayT